MGHVCTVSAAFNLAEACNALLLKAQTSLHSQRSNKQMQNHRSVRFGFNGPFISFLLIMRDSTYPTSLNALASLTAGESNRLHLGGHRGM